MKTYVGVTDSNWSRFLTSRPHITEANFWQPGGGTMFKVLQRGEPFLFKSKWNDGNQLIGGGYFEGFVFLKVSEAWEIFGEGNGVSSFDEMIRLIGQYRTLEPAEDPVIGCILLNDISFVRALHRVNMPSDFKRNIVKGKSYKIGLNTSNPVIDLFVRNLAITSDSELTTELQPRQIAGPVFGDPLLVRPRLGQGGFKSLVREAYERKCAITGHKIIPTLQAAHIIPVSKSGENRIDNGILLRSDVHTLFDRGYLGIAPDFTLRVSPKLRTEFGNGEEYYSRSGTVISLPSDTADQPKSSFLEWHMDSVFRSS